MPGVPTMWLGSIGRLVWGIGRDVGVVEGRSTFYESRSGLTAAQLSVAVATSLLIGLVVWLVARWAASPRAGLVAGLLLATEPFWVAHGSVIHTDELTSLFGLSGLLALGLVLGVPRVDDAVPAPPLAGRAGRLPAGLLAAHEDLRAGLRPGRVADRGVGGGAGDPEPRPGALGRGRAEDRSVVPSPWWRWSAPWRRC